MLDDNYKVYNSSGTFLSKLISIATSGIWETYSRDRVIEIMYFTPVIKTKKGFFILKLIKEAREQMGGINKVATFMVTKIANEDRASLDSISLSERVQRFHVNNFDNNEALLQEIDRIFRENFF
ncbi:MAG: hypothetical protein K1060chlam1_00877 [Candidatus Anoxychlamydiales bacterium]|nr:hypothetical protein [Candidatus Anoxychlamydiales bacterium]